MRMVEGHDGNAQRGAGCESLPGDLIRVARLDDIRFFGFQDAFDDDLTDNFFAIFYQGWNTLANTGPGGQPILTAADLPPAARSGGQGLRRPGRHQRRADRRSVRLPLEPGNHPVRTAGTFSTGYEQVCRWADGAWACRPGKAGPP